MKNRSLLILILSITSFSMVTAQPQQTNVHQAVDFILGKFDNHDIVAIGETHGKAEVTDLYIDLIKNDKFREKVDFIVIEMGNHLFQDILDDYVSGKPVEKAELYKLWRDHTSCMLNGSDNTGLIRFLETVREQNLNSENKIRIIAGDPDIDWTKVDCLQEFYKYLGSRDEFYSKIVEDYIVHASKKGLLIMGNSHFNRQRTKSMQERDQENPITSIMKTDKAKLYLLNIIASASFPYKDMKAVKSGSVITSNDPWLGKLKIGSPFIKDYTLKEQTDGIIYLGERESLTSEKTTDFSDHDYTKELERRNSLPNCSDK